MVALVAGLVAGSGGASASSGDAQVTLNCQTNNGLVDCTLISDRELDSAEGLEFTVNVGGTTQTVTVTRGANLDIRSSQSCGNSEGICYGFLFMPQQTGDSVEVGNIQAIGQVAPTQTGGSSTDDADTADGSSTDDADTADGSSTDDADTADGSSTDDADTADGSSTDDADTADGSSTDEFPCSDNPDYTCTSEAPTGDNVVYIHNDGQTLTIDPGNNGEDETDTQHNYNAGQPAESREELESKRDARDAVQDIPSDQMVVMTAANGYQTPEQQQNAFSLEEQLWERGEPYMVCFDPITLVEDGVEYTYQADCVIITPY